MSDKKLTDTENAIKNLKHSLKELAHEIKGEKKHRQEKQEKEKQKRAKIQENYNNWFEKLRPEAEKSAHIIFEWVNQFLKSDSLKEIVSEVGEQINSIDISENIIFEGPTLSIYHPYGRQGYQSLSLSFDENLFVHNNVKYGKSHEIRNVKNMIKEVHFPVIIKIAETIKDGSIWSIIEKELKRRLKNHVRSIREYGIGFDDDDFSDDD